MKIIHILLIFTILALLVSTFGSAQADGSSPWGEILNPDGSIQWSKLTDLGVTHEEANWMDITLPGGLVIKQQATFHRYRTPSGNILVLPSPGTLFFMALNPKDSGLNNAQSMLGNGASILTMLLGNALTPGQLAQIAKKGYTDPRQFFQAVIDGKESIWSVINFTFFSELIKFSLNSGFLVNALLLYLKGVANCSNIPGGCAGLATGACPNGGCLPNNSICPVPTIVQTAPTLFIQKIAPGHPLVVGQDPNKRGADIQVSASIPPVVFTWYQPVQDPPICQFNANGNGGGCAGPGNQYGHVVDQNGSSISWSPSLENNSSWKVVDGPIRCIRHVEVLPETITSLQASAQLDANSQSWILNNLAGKYYEAFIHHPLFNLVPGLVQASTGCGSDKTCSAKTVISGVPFADPGTFDLWMAVSTAGTIFHYKGVDIPITQPRVLTAEGSMQVYVTLVTLIPAGVP